MADYEKSLKKQRGLESFEPGGDFGPFENRAARGERLDRLDSPEKELVAESARFADLCQYFEQQKMDVLPEIIDELGRLSRLGIAERIEAMKKLNQRLMEYLSDGGENRFVRQ